MKSATISLSIILRWISRNIRKIHKSPSYVNRIINSLRRKIRESFNLQSLRETEDFPILREVFLDNMNPESYNIDLSISHSIVIINSWSDSRSCTAEKKKQETLATTRCYNNPIITDVLSVIYNLISQEKILHYNTPHIRAHRFS